MLELFGSMTGKIAILLGLGWVFQVVFWGLIILAVVSLVRKHNNDAYYKKKSPLDVLKERYASGEIGKEQFEQMKNDLEK